MNRRHVIKSTAIAAIAAMALGAMGTFDPASADALDEIKERGTMIVAIDPTFAPFEFTDSSGKIVGYDPELLAADWGVEVEYQVMAFSGVIPGLIAGSFDFTATALNITAERAQKINYTIPVSSTVNAVLTTKGNDKVTSSDINGLSGLKCAVKQTTQPEQMMQSMNEELSGAGKAEVELLSYDTVEQTIAALADGRVDCVVDDLAVLHQAMANRPDMEMEVVGEIGSKALIGWGTNKADPELTAALSESLSKLKASGKMGELQEKYFGYRIDDLPEENFIPSE
jgi:polar amino acid transport system substrate-binding protein